MPILKGTEEPHDPVCFREDGKRLDGRAVDEIRPFSCEIGVIKNAQGSAFVQHGGNQIYAAVYGPREVHPRHLAKPDRGILRVYYRMCTFSVHERKSPAPNRRENEISKVIREALDPVLFLEAYPDSQIEVFVEVVAADGGTRCASTTAASLALADAGIPMKSLVVGIAAGKAQGKVLLDLGDKEDKVGQADVPTVVVMKDKSISLLQFDGEMTIEEMELGFKYIMKGAEEIHQKQLESLKNKYSKIAEEAKEEDRHIVKDGTSESDEPADDLEDGNSSDLSDENAPDFSDDDQDINIEESAEDIDDSDVEEESEESIGDEEETDSDTDSFSTDNSVNPGDDQL